MTDEAELLVSSLKCCYLNIVGILIARLANHFVLNLVQVRLIWGEEELTLYLYAKILSPERF